MSAVLLIIKLPFYIPLASFLKERICEADNYILAVINKQIQFTTRFLKSLFSTRDYFK